MERAWVLLLLTCILAESFASPRGLISYLDNGELCLQSLQCKSGCCLRTIELPFPRCTKRAAENQECSLQNFYGAYFRCPCEIGFTCDVDQTIVRDITNFGICQDPAKRK